jgi:hypothetical protein
MIGQKLPLRPKLIAERLGKNGAQRRSLGLLNAVGCLMLLGSEFDQVIGFAALVWLVVFSRAADSFAA